MNMLTPEKITICFQKLVVRWMFAVMISAVIIHRAAAQDITVDIKTQMTIFQTIVTFERMHRTDSNGAIRVAIVYQSKFRKSVVAYEEIASLLKDSKNKGQFAPQVLGVDLDIGNPEEIVAGKNISVLLVCPLRGASISELSALCRTYRFLSMTVVPEYVTKGISIGIDIKDAKPLILLNRSAAKSEGDDFDSRLFNFVKIVDKEN